MAKAPTYNPDSVSDAQTAGIRHIGIGTCSSGKMREYLRKKGFSDQAVKEAVDELIRREYIDDYRAGRKVLLCRSGKKQESRRFLRERLYAAGVSSNVSDLLIQEVAEDSVLCFNLYLSAIPEVSDESEDHEAELMKLAAKRGFGLDVARSAYGKWLEKVIDDKQK